MAKRDYYEVLGVSKNSTDKEIKKGFKNLAKKYHPDIYKGDDKDEKFKEIQEAYAVLSDAQKRSQYDQFGHAAFDGGGFNHGQGGAGFGDFDFSDIFSEIFGGGFSGGFSGHSRQGQNAPRKGRDVEMAVELSFKEAVFGATRDIKLDLEDTCHTCNGVGAENPSDVKTCVTCNGQGKVQRRQQTILGTMMSESICPTCHGSGKEISNPCKECHGNKRVVYPKTINVKFPAGVENGAYMRLTGKGEAGVNGGPSGDLYLNVQVRKDEFFERDGLDVRIEIPITYTQAVLGGKIDVPTLHGDVELKIPAGIQASNILKMKHKGIKAENKTAGDQYVKVRIQVPQSVSGEEKELLKKLAKFEDKHNEQESFFGKIKDLFH